MSFLHPWDGNSELSLREWPEPQPRHETPTALADLVSAIFRNKRGIAIALLVFVSCVTAFLVLTHKTYESHVTYLVRSEGAAFPITTFDNQGAVAEMTSELVSDTQIGTEVELLSDTELHRKVLQSLQPQSSAAKIDGQLISFGKHLKVLPIPKTTLISVTYIGTSRESANATLKALNQQYLASRASIRGSDKAFKFFDSEANRYYRQLQADQHGLAEFESQNQVTLLEEEKDLVTRRLSETRAFLNENEASQAESSRKLAKMMVQHDTLPSRIETQKRQLPDQLSEGHFNSLLVDLQNKRQELLTKYHESDRHVQEVDQQIQNTRLGLEQVKASTATEVQSDVNPIRTAVDLDLEHLKVQTVGLQAAQKSLKSQIAAYEGKLQQLDQITAQHDDLVRSIRQDEGDYDLYSKRREEARIDKTLDGNKIANVSLVAGPAINPERLSQRVLAIASVYLIGSVLIIGIGAVTGLWSPKFHAPWEIEAVAGTSVLATIPSFSNISSRAVQQSQFAKVSSYSALIERLRRIGTSHPGGLAFAFTSSVRGEGVSHVVRGLSEELHRLTGKRVAVVTAPKSLNSSLSNMLSMPAEVDSRFKESGEESLKNWFRRLRETNDYVLIDCPSMQESHAAVTLGRESDGVLMVVGAGDATRIQLRGSMTALSLASIPLVGIAMNKRDYPIPNFIYRAL